MAISKITSDAIDATDFNLDSDTLKIDSTNNRVGVVNASPATALDVTGTITTDNLTIDGDIDHKDAANNDRTLYDKSSNLLGNLGTNVTANAIGIGTTSPNKTLEINNSTSPTLRIGDGTRHFEILGGSTTQTAGIGTGYSSAFTFNINSTERMRIDSSGNVGIGTTTTAGKLTIGGDDAFEAITLRDNTASANMFSITSAEYVGSGGNPNKLTAVNSSAISFELGGSERMRLSHTSSALSLGKTTFGTAGQGFTVYGNTAPQCYFNKSQSGTVNGVLFYHSNSYVGGLNYNNTNTSLATSSDERLKENIENSDDAGAKIDAMQVRQFDWKSTGEHQEYGFVAQELEPVFAHAVHTDLEGDYKSVDYGCFVPMLIKEIQSLRQRITDLENTN